MRQTIKRPGVFIPDMFGASFDNYAVYFFRKKTSLILLDDSNSYYGSRFLINPSRETDVPITKLCDECDFLAHRFSLHTCLKFWDKGVASRVSGDLKRKKGSSLGLNRVAYSADELVCYIAVRVIMH